MSNKMNKQQVQAAYNEAVYKAQHDMGGSEMFGKMLDLKAQLDAMPVMPTDEEMTAEMKALNTLTERVWYASTGTINKCVKCGELDVSGDAEWRNHVCIKRTVTIQDDNDIPF